MVKKLNNQLNKKLGETKNTENYKTAFNRKQMKKAEQKDEKK